MERGLFMKVFKGMALLLLVLLFCRFSAGVGAAILAAAAFVCALTHRNAWALMGYILFPFMVVMNPFFLPKTGISGMVLRLAPMLIAVGLVVSSFSRHGRHNIPIGMLWVYLGVAALSSMTGYCPMISYLKISNFAVLLAGIGLGFRNIDRDPSALQDVRLFLLVLTAFVVYGSIGMRIFLPGAAYCTSFSAILVEEGLEAANDALTQNVGGMTLFAGIANHSQCLAVVLPCSLAWLACDMLFVERHISTFHVVTIFAGVPLIYLTRSRAALLISVVTATVIYFYCLNKIRLNQRVRGKLRSMMVIAGMMVFVVAVVAEVKNGAMTKWIRKTNDLSGDTRSVSEAFTGSRQRKINECLSDFRRNPLLGSGFQVTETMKYRFRNAKGIVLSASIEKGLLPLMVLGETGVVGSIVFVIYLVIFYSTCIKKRYFCCLSMKTTFLASNMAEATFFSPGGVGGILWILCIGGGFVIDMYVKNMERGVRRIAF